LNITQNCETIFKEKPGSLGAVWGSGRDKGRKKQKRQVFVPNYFVKILKTKD
jgi:hypothetical protein